MMKNYGENSGENTHLFKLSWKQEYPTNIDGADTFYGKIINESI